MTRRERLERKLEKRREWAEGRRHKAADLNAQNDRYRGDWAFNTQPGHIPERARAIARTERAWEHCKVAQHHESKAAGLEAQIQRAIYSDDPDAAEALEAKAAALEAACDRANAVNAAWRKARKGLAELEAPAPGWSGGLLAPSVEASETTAAMQYSWLRRKGPMETTNDRANARRLRERIKAIQAQAERSEAAEAAGGVVIGGNADWAVVTFAEKPDRSVLEALKAAGFRWGAGSWHGPREKLPPL